MFGTISGCPAAGLLLQQGVPARALAHALAAVRPDPHGEQRQRQEAAGDEGKRGRRGVRDLPRRAVLKFFLYDVEVDDL